MSSLLLVPQQKQKESCRATLKSAQRRMLMLRNEVPGTKPLIRRNVTSANCETICSIPKIPPDASYIQCFDSYISWCCNADTVAFMQGIQNYEYLRMPEPDFNISSISHKMQTRRDKELVLPMHLSATRKTDLPFAWTKLVAKVAGK